MATPLKILLVEDNPVDAELLLVTLRRAGFDPDGHRVDTEAGFLEGLNEKLDLVLADYEMPEFSGLRALELLNQRRTEVPFIIVSGTIGEETAVAAMKLGATDYLIKDRLARLGTAVEHALEQSRLRRERRLMAEALREQEEQYKKLVEVSTNAIFVNWNTTFVLLNPSALKLFGATHESQLLGRSPFDFLHRDYHQIVKERIHRTLHEAELATSMEVILLRLDGSSVVAEVTGSRYQFRGEPATLVEARDITERKRAEKELRLFRTLVDQSSDAFEVIDPANGRFLDMNDKGCAAVGYSRAEILSLGVEDIDPMVKAVTWAAVAQKVRDAGQQSGEGVHLRKDGTTFPVEFNARWVHMDRDYIVTVVRDISERKNVQRVAAREQARFQFIFGAVPVGIAWMARDDRSSRIVNSAHARITGVPIERCQELELYRERTHPDDWPKQAELHQRFTAREIDSYAVEKRYIHADESIVWAVLTYHFYYDPETGEAQEISTLVDITERKLGEKKVSDQLHELQRWHDVTLDREERVTALKGEVNDLLKHVGEPPRYRDPET